MTPRHRIELATPDLGAELASIYDSDDGFSGDIAVKYTRSPDAHASLLAEGDRVVIPVVREMESGDLIGMGACVVRTAWVNGRPTTVGYLTGLKALPRYRRGLPMIPDVYAFLREQTPDVECYYTTILTENTLARKLLERDRPRMPHYEPVANYTTCCFRGPRVVRPSRAKLTGGTVGELVALVDGARGRLNLAPVGPPPGVRDEDVRLLRVDGEVKAWCAVQDQRDHKQYVVTNYGGAYERVAKLPVHWLGYPRLPRPGAVADLRAITALGAVGDDPRWASELLRSVGRTELAHDFCMLGFADASPFASVLAGRRTITYSSQLYTVHFDDRCLGLDGRAIGLDVAGL